MPQFAASTQTGHAQTCVLVVSVLAHPMLKVRCMRRRSKFSLLPLWTLIAFGCLSDSVSYSPEADTEAFTAIASTWSADGVTLSLCEDVTAVEQTGNCIVDHTVRGGGRGRRHDEDHSGVGCGGCPFSNMAYVTGTVSGGGLPADTVVEGSVSLGVTAGGPYGFPYVVSLTCVDPEHPCQLGGRLDADGSLELTDYGAVGSAEAQRTLVRTSAATCP